MVMVNYLPAAWLLVGVLENHWKSYKVYSGGFSEALLSILQHL